MLSLKQLRAHAIVQTLFRPTTLKAALDRLGFVQADPIRSPARAQDFILRHRVKGYVAGDLDRRYSSLAIEEDVLYAYGFLSREVWNMSHPRKSTRLSVLEKRVLDAIRASGPVHPSELAAEFGRKRVVNAWGGYSKATKCALENLHYRGLLRIARRQNGIRVYEAASLPQESISSDHRFRALVLAVAGLLAPVPLTNLQGIANRLRRFVPGIADSRKALRALRRSGQLEEGSVDGISYVWPVSSLVHDEPSRCVRFLAPFDPLVWDRQRFEHFWGWRYRFEAYTPPAKRLRGYYAMPVLWSDQIVGWANASVVGGVLSVELGFAGEQPKGGNFGEELDAEIARLKAFLNLRKAPRPFAGLVLS